MDSTQDNKQDNQRTTPEEHEELRTRFGTMANARPGPGVWLHRGEWTKEDEQALPHNVHVWMGVYLPWMGMRQEKHISEVQQRIERRMGRYSKIRLTDWGFDARKVIPEDMIACARVITGWANARKRNNGIRHGLDTGEYFVLMLRQMSCVSCPDMWTDAKNVLHAAIAKAQAGGYTCAVCYDVGQILKLGNGCCGDPACTDLVNANPTRCKCQYRVNHVDTSNDTSDESSSE